jgi:potassium-transporting ATPase potassium-binding subunit
VTAQGFLQIGVYVVALTALTPLVGGYMARVYRGERIALVSAVVGPVERLTYRLIRANPAVEQDWRAYARTAIVFSALSWGGLYLILSTQGAHPLNPEDFGPAPWDVTFNTASSFVSNTNWQFYGGETTLSYFSQMAGLTVQNFVSAAVGIAVALAVIRGFVARGGSALGNFWQDLVRTLLYVLVPLSFLIALFFVSQGVIQNLSPYVTYGTLAGGEQTLALGPVASQEAIKLLGTNGGGFFNVNSTMPVENPSGLANFVQMLSILLIPAGLTSVFGRFAGNRRQGWAIYSAMLTLFAVAVVVAYAAEANGSPAQHLADVAGANMEGKEVRFGLAASSLFTVITTVASCGAVNTSLDSLTGIGGLVPMFNMSTGEVVFGGVGSGLYGMLLFVLLAVFIAGLMVGRTPEYLGKKIEAREVKLVMVGTLFVPLAVLFATALAIGTKWGAPSIYNPGPQGFSETLYAYLSQGNNNGSAFAGYTGFVQPNAPGNAGAFGITFADLLGGLAMLAGRFVPLIAALAVAGALVSKRVAPLGPGSFRTDTPTFTGLLVFTIVIVAALTFFPAFLLGPIVQGLTDQLF